MIGREEFSDEHVALDSDEIEAAEEVGIGDE